MMNAKRKIGIYTSAVMLPEAALMPSPVHVSAARSMRVIVSAAAIVLSCALYAADIERTGGPYVPTPQTVVDAMLDFAKVGPKDVVIDLGSGDGRIVLTAAQRYGARGQGFDIDPELVAQSNAEAKKRGIADRVSFVQQDVLQAPIDAATVVTLYLLPGMMQNLQAKFIRELKPGTRIVSHDFPFGEWKPDRETSVDVPEKYGSPGQWKSTLFYWVVPARVQGVWQVSAPAISAQPLPLTLQQQYQVLDGSTNAGGKPVPVAGGKVDADRVVFRLALPAGTYEFKGVVDGDRMRGEASSGGRTFPWTAVRSQVAAQVP
jgi:SAM-dependent methyltransferase